MPAVPASIELAAATVGIVLALSAAGFIFLALQRLRTGRRIPAGMTVAAGSVFLD